MKLPADPSGEGTEQSLSRRLEFLELTAQDAALLRSMRPTFAALAEELVERFYRHLFAFPEAAAFLEDPALVERLKSRQQEHFQSLLAAQWDEAYVAQRQRVGRAHADVGIAPTLFLGAYNQYTQFCLKHLCPVGTPEEVDRACALMKVIFLDLGLTLEAYFERSTRLLRDALDMYWRANTELRHFAQLTSHDLKTPLATVTNLCDEVLDEFGQGLPAEARRLITAARDRACRMATMINELLSSVLSASGTDEHGPVSMGPVIEEALERVRPVCRRKSIDVFLPDAWPSVWGTKVRLEEAFYNLLANAAKFIDKEPGRIEIRVLEDERSYTFEIEDNGPGIPPEEQERIFVPFHRMVQHRDRPGSGLGLYFTKQLVEMQGGQVTVRSQPGQGSCFSVRLLRPSAAGQE